MHGQETRIESLVRRKPLLALRGQADALFGRMPAQETDFLRKFVDTGSYFELDVDSPALSTYTPYLPYRQSNTFLGKCSFGRNDPNAFAISLAHQASVALAWSNAAVLHANPSNPLAPAVLLPEHFALVSECLAQDAYAKQAWIASRAAQVDPSFYAQTERDPVSARQFEVWHKKEGLSGALAMAAHASMAKPYKEGSTETFGDLIHASALSLCQSQIDWLHRENIRVQFAHLEREDIQDIGNTFGPNILPEVQSIETFRMNTANTLRAGDLRKVWNIGNDVPTLTESLARSAHKTRAGFLAKSIGARGMDALVRH